MKNSPRQSLSRKKDKEKRSRKSTDAIEGMATGNGWTTAAIQRFIDLKTSEERLNHVKAMFNVNNNEYMYNRQLSYHVDFQFANGCFCAKANYDIPMFQFTCRSITSMWKMIINAAESQNQDIDFKSLKEDLLSSFQSNFKDFSKENAFTAEQLDEILDHVAACVLKPIRMIYAVYHFPEKEEVIETKRKVFQPITPEPLKNCKEYREEPPLEMQFSPPILPLQNTMSLEQVKETIANYTNQMIEKINTRFDNLEALVENINQNYI